MEAGGRTSEQAGPSSPPRPRRPASATAMGMGAVRNPMAVAPHQRSTSDHLLIIWQGPSAGRPAGEGGPPGSCDRVAGGGCPLATPGGVSGYGPMSLPAPILTLTPLTPLTPLFGRKRALLGGGGRGEGPLPGGEGRGCFPNEWGVRVGEGTPRVHGQDFRRRGRKSAKGG